jgi:hypothetical protein
MAPPRRCQNIKCPCTGTGVLARSALERGGACSRVVRTLERGGACSRYAYPLERGGACLREACALERGRACSRGSLSGPLWWAVRASVAWAMPCVLKRGGFGFGLLRVLSGDSPVVLRGPLGLSPTSVSAKSTQALELDFGYVVVTSIPSLRDKICTKLLKGSS